VIAIKRNGKRRGVARNRWRKAEFIGHFGRTEGVTRKLEEEQKRRGRFE
jgi:hypothetical protein